MENGRVLYLEWEVDRTAPLAICKAAVKFHGGNPEMIFGMAKMVRLQIREKMIDRITWVFPSKHTLDELSTFSDEEF